MARDRGREADRPKCPACERLVRPGIVCQQTVCPWEHALNRDLKVVLARPLRQRIK
jgi:NAD-dependent SIR2 family protein deacetylase